MTYNNYSVDAMSCTYNVHVPIVFVYTGTAGRAVCDKQGDSNVNCEFR